MTGTGKTENREVRPARLAGVLLLFLLFLTTLNIGVARAVEGDGEPPAVLEDVVVEGQAMDDNFRTGDVDPTQLTSFSTVIDLEKVDPGISSLGDLLAKEVGIQVRSMGGIGGYSSVSLRGTSGDQVFVYLDGVLMNDASGGGVDLSMVPLNDIAAIEIYRGISPVNFARAGLGGVINIRTKRSKPGTGGSAGFGFGSFNTRRFFGSLSHQTENHYDLLAVGEYLDSDNNFKFWNDNGTEWNPHDDRREKRNNNEIFRRSLLLKGGHDFSDDVRFELTEQYFNQDRRIPTWNNYPKATTHLHTERHQVTANFQADNRGPLHLNLSGIAFYSWKKELYSDLGGNVGLGRQRDRNKTEKYGGSFFGELPTEYQVLSLNCEAGRETYKTEDLLYSRPRGQSRRNYVSAALQESIYLFDQRLLLTPAAHYQWYDDKLDSATSSYGMAIPGQSRKHDNLSPSLGLRLDLWGPFQLRANAACYYREPSFYELFGDRGLVVGNPDLKAEKGQNYDVGLVCDWVPPWPWLSRINLEGIIFYSKIKNLITQIYDARGVGRSENIARARIAGFEGRFRADLGPYLTLSGNGTWQNTTDRGAIASFRNNELPGRWQRSFMGRVEGHIEGFKAYFEYLLSKDMYYDSANLLPADSKRLLNFGFAWTQTLPTGELTIDFTVRNLNGDTYEDFNGYPMPKQEYYTNLTYHF